MAACGYVARLQPGCDLPLIVNVHTGVVQLGEQTFTCMRHFVLSGPGQVHDVHTKLRLQHPRGEATQLHKCIVSAPSGEPNGCSHTIELLPPPVEEHAFKPGQHCKHGLRNAAGRGVFDGNVKVERLAQQTDAKQLSRNLLLVKNATVNVKPNLQIIADDVKCTHGCTVSDLEENQLFYFRCATAMCFRSSVCVHFMLSLQPPSSRTFCRCNDVWYDRSAIAEVQHGVVQVEGHRQRYGAADAGVLLWCRGDAAPQARAAAGAPADRSECRPCDRGHSHSCGMMRAVEPRLTVSDRLPTDVQFCKH